MIKLVAIDMPLEQYQALHVYLAKSRDDHVLRLLTSAHGLPAELDTQQVCAHLYEAFLTLDKAPHPKLFGQDDTE